MDLNVPRRRLGRLDGANAPDVPEPAEPPHSDPGSWRHWQHFRLLGAGLLLAVGAAAVYSHYLSVQLTNGVARIETLRSTIEESRRFLGYVVDLESGHRGYLLTGDARQLESYKMADAALPQQLTLLEQRLATRPGLQELVEQMREMLSRKRREMSAMLMLYESAGRPRSLQSVGGDLGKFEMDSLRLSTQALEHALNQAAGVERRRVAQLISARSVAMNTTLVVVALIGAVAMVLGARHFDALRRQDQLRGEVARSRHQSDVKSTFLAHVSHEIRTPMNAIFGFSGLLHDRLRDPVNRRYIDAIIDSARSLLGLINDLLDLSKIESGKIEIADAPASVQEIVDGVLTMFSQLADNRGVVLRSDIHADVPPAVRVDGDRLRQMLVNLVGNALKYTEHGEVVVRVTAESGSAPTTVTCRFEVEDTGSGIDAEDLRTIFEPFARGRSHDGHGPAGTGLGLSITRQLARAMGGDVGVSSEVGRGSRFVVLLPDLEVSAEPHPTAPGAQRLRSLPPMRVLVVDDVELNRRVLSALFRESAHQIRLAQSGAEALRIVSIWVPHVMLVDIRMPGMSGIELVRRLRADSRLRDIRVIAVTASNIDPVSELGDLFDGIVVKPFGEAALAREISRAVGEVAAPQALPPPEPPAPQAAEPVDERLLDELEALLAKTWPGVRDTPTVGEVRQFADRVEGVGRRNGSPAVTQYARKLGGAATSFDVARIESLLSEFPSRVSEVRNQLTAGAHSEG